MAAAIIISSNIKTARRVVEGAPSTTRRRFKRPCITVFQRLCTLSSFEHSKQIAANCVKLACSHLRKKYCRLIILLYNMCRHASRALQAAHVHAAGLRTCVLTGAAVTFVITHAAACCSLARTYIRGKARLKLRTQFRLQLKLRWFIVARTCRPAATLCHAATLGACILCC
jgi:hypothetical protein